MQGEVRIQRERRGVQTHRRDRRRVPVERGNYAQGELQSVRSERPQGQLRGSSARRGGVVGRRVLHVLYRNGGHPHLPKSQGRGHDVHGGQRRTTRAEELNHEQNKARVSIESVSIRRYVLVASVLQ